MMRVMSCLMSQLKGVGLTAVCTCTGAKEGGANMRGSLASDPTGFVSEEQRNEYEDSFGSAINIRFVHI